VVALASGAAAPSRVERAALPVAAVAAAALVALALLAGRLLDRQARAIRIAAERERLEGLARAGAGLAHQLRNPLATIRGSAQLLLESCSGAEAARLGAIVSESDRLGRLVDELLDYARPPQPQPQPIDLATFRPERDLARVDWQVAEGLAAHADPEHLRLILDNLLDNALEADPGRIEVGARARRDGVEIAVLDRGPGPGPDPEQLFEPYVTGKASGTGLGLPLARSLAAANGGSLRLVPRAGGGTEALLWLPAAEGTR
jgi:signal transduction histidine kinase